MVSTFEVWKWRNGGFIKSPMRKFGVVPILQSSECSEHVDHVSHFVCTCEDTLDEGPSDYPQPVFFYRLQPWLFMYFSFIPIADLTLSYRA